MIDAPIREPVGDGWTPEWVRWLAGVVLALGGWRKSMSATLTHDFSSVAAQSQASTTLTVAGAKPGAAVTVTPLADTSGILYAGVVTAIDTVTIYAKNFTAGAINPDSTTFRVILFQQ